MNFRDPLELTQIFRYKEIDETIPPPIDHEYDAILAKVRTETEEKEEEKYKEFTNKLWITWEDIKSIAEYPYPDDWEQHKGDKYCIELRNASNPNILVLGDVHSIVEHWTKFRNLAYR